MAGCFGNHPFDAQMEQELDRYLEMYDKIECEKCGYISDEEGYYQDEDTNEYICPKCSFRFKN